MQKFLLQLKSGLPRSSTAEAGFTLVELLVSLALFSIVVVAAIGSLYTVNQASQRVNAMRTVLDNLNFATESMSRTIRTSTVIECPGLNDPNCTGGGTALILNSTLGTDNGTKIEYRWAESGGHGQIEKCGIDPDGGTQNCVSVTAPEINITKAEFYVQGAEHGDGLQTGVMMLIQGSATAGPESTETFAIQTFISQRSVN